MKNLTILLFAILPLFSFGQFGCIESIEVDGCNISFKNSDDMIINQMIISEINLFKNPSGEWILEDERKTIKLTRKCLSAPSYDDVDDFLIAAGQGCSSGGGGGPGGSVTVVNDTWIKDPDLISNPIVSAINGIPNPIDSIYYVQLDSIIELLSIRDTIRDTLKTAVYDTWDDIIDGETDTIFNLKGYSFSWNSAATGSVTFNYANGRTSTRTPSDPLPSSHIENGFISMIGWDATAATGLSVNIIGGQESDGNPCVKLKPLEDCENGPLLIINGWKSINGVWTSSGGYWGNQ